MALYSTSKGIMTDDLLFSIADQIMHDIDNPAIGDNPELRIDIAKLYMLAGTKAADRSDFAASRSYSTYALSILPTDHWISHYDLSLRCSFRSAKSCYSCGDKDKAQCMLEELIGHCHSIEDKVPALSLVAKSEYNKSNDC
jgi:predicted ATPase